MDRQAFELTLREFLLPMYPGASIDGVSHGLFQSESLVAREDRREILLRIPCEKFSYLRFGRPESFTTSEIEFLGKFVKIVHDAAARGMRPDFMNLSSQSIREAIAGVAMDGNRTFYNALELVQTWNERSYEGRPIRTAYGFNPDSVEHTGIHLETFFRESFGPVISNGEDTLLEFTAKGFLVGHHSLSRDAVEKFAPARYSSIANWASEGRVALTTNENRETLVFRDARLAFARRRGEWHQFSHDHVVDALQQSVDLPPRMCHALHETMLDVSFENTGGCIAVINRSDMQHQSDFLSAVAHDCNWLSSSQERKARCFAAMIAGRPFDEIPRRLRREIASLDGALLLDSTGAVLAVGALVQIAPSSFGGGGRLAAARTLAAFGLAACISCDGRVSGFASDRAASQPRLLFAFG